MIIDVITAIFPYILLYVVIAMMCFPVLLRLHHPAPQFFMIWDTSIGEELREAIEHYREIGAPLQLRELVFFDISRLIILSPYFIGLWIYLRLAR